MASRDLPDIRSYTCDEIWENVHCLYIQFFNFSNSYYLFRRTDRCETFRNCRTNIPLSFLKVSIFTPLLVVFMDLRMSKIGCVNYARFPKSGHIYEPDIHMMSNL